MNNNIFTFHKTVIGYRHILEEIPCQDSSSSYNADNENYQTIFLIFKKITVPKRYNVFSVKFSICNRILQKCFCFR